MGNFADPFVGYTVLLRIIIYVLIPAFTLWQVVRLRRALHVFQLEGYKRRRFLEWCNANRRRALFMGSGAPKKPLVMTGRARRLLIASAALSVVVILLMSGGAHVGLGGWPADVVSWATSTAIVFVAAPYLLVAADALLAPAQHAINRRYVSRARTKLEETNPVVVGVTGSFGKTSTKFAVAQLLGSAEETLATPGSFNTPLGVCRTINERLEPGHRYFVVEMGAYGVGEIAELCRFVRPTVGVLTAIGPAHLERFGSLDNIRAAKYEIVEGLPEEGVAVMNVDDPEVRLLADRTRRVPVVRYGIDDEARPDVTARSVTVTPNGTAMTIEDHTSGDSLEVTTKLLGRHAVGHVLAGVAVARSVGRRLVDLRDGIARLEPVEHRLQLIDGAEGVTVIDDAYNSNPEGAAAALDVLAAMPARHRIVVSPGIVELGPLQFDANRAFGARAACVADVVIVVAQPNRAAIVAGAESAGGRARVIQVDSLAGATSELERLLGPGDVVLFENDLPDQYEN
jgi:UDP-N-acetylmuramoyl-tripeptide--D-alanyl-D-alanine ligase